VIWLPNRPPAPVEVEVAAGVSAGEENEAELVLSS
jgi:hypothetical protein